MYVAIHVHKIITNQHELVAVVKVVDKAAKRSLGVRMYWRQRRFDRVKRSQLANHVLPYVCMGVVISPLYPSYLATKVSLSCFSSCLILVRALYPS